MDSDDELKLELNSLRSSIECRQEGYLIQSRIRRLMKAYGLTEHNLRQRMSTILGDIEMAIFDENLGVLYLHEDNQYLIHDLWLNLLSDDSSEDLIINKLDKLNGLGISDEEIEDLVYLLCDDTEYDKVYRKLNPEVFKREARKYNHQRRSSDLTSFSENELKSVRNDKKGESIWFVILLILLAVLMLKQCSGGSGKSHYDDNPLNEYSPHPRG